MQSAVKDRLADDLLPTPKRSLWEQVVRHRQVYLFLIPAIVYFAIFHYGPMYGVQIAFKRFLASRGITGSPWIGFYHFDRLFRSFQFPLILRNTVFLSLGNLVFGFPIPILFALLLNQIPRHGIRRFVQTVTYAPHFISTVVVAGIIMIFTRLEIGPINIILRSMGFEAIFFMGHPGWFRPLYILSEIWQRTGWDSIIYLAALAGISFELHEAAIADGANKLQRIWHIDIPGILPTATVLLILRFGNLMRLGFEKALLLQTALNLEASEIIQTYVYKVGLQQAQFSFASAVGLFNSVINLGLIVMVNWIARRYSETSLW
jgi:putative aldouronate transport system permease protein